MERSALEGGTNGRITRRNKRSKKQERIGEEEEEGGGEGQAR